MNLVVSARCLLRRTKGNARKSRHSLTEMTPLKLGEWINLPFVRIFVILIVFAFLLSCKNSLVCRIEEQVQAMTFDDETGDYASINAANYQSVDSKMFDHKLNIEGNYAVIDSDNAAFESSNVQLPEYATVDIQKKHETREKKSKATRNNSSAIYEDIQIGEIDNAENNIYELVSPEYASIVFAKSANPEGNYFLDEEIYAEVNN